MRECAKVKRILSRYIDNEATDADTALVRSHLERCLPCRQEFSALAGAKGLISGMERKVLPQDYLILRLREKIADERRLRERPSLAGMGILARKLIPVPVAAIIASLIFLFLTSAQPAAEYSLEEHIFSANPATTETALELILGSQN